MRKTKKDRTLHKQSGREKGESGDTQGKGTESYEQLIPYKYKLSTEALFKNKEIKQFLIQFKLFLKKHLDSFSCLPLKGHQQLRKTIKYSLFSGGKYFRPLLIFATARSMKVRTSYILPWAAAIEMIHSASLIHDDLPCMDDSHQRRGKVSCHKKFGEDMALLAGDCLWIEAFRLIHIHTKKDKEKLKWLFLLCQATGFTGLMGGQALDLKIPSKPNEYYYKKMHFLKTGALIAASMEGVLILQDKKSEKKQRIQKAAQIMGRAFQISDDLQDEFEKNTSNFSHTLGRKKAQNDLNILSNKALKLINFDNSSSSILKKLIIFNQHRAFIDNKG